LSSSNKRYSREFKLEVVRRIQSSGQSQAGMARELDVAPNTVSRWVRQFRDEKSEAFPGKGSQTSQAALISRLRRENERLRKERDFLKKTAAYFAATNESDTE